MTPTNINFTPQKYAGAVGLDRSPAPASKLTLAGTPAQPRFAPLQEKNIRHGPLTRLLKPPLTKTVPQKYTICHKFTSPKKSNKKVL